MSDHIVSQERLQLSLFTWNILSALYRREICNSADLFLRYVVSFKVSFAFWWPIHHNSAIDSDVNAL